MSDVQAGPCVGCGATNYSLSYGGPAVCPMCDISPNLSARVRQQQIDMLKNLLADSRMELLASQSREKALSEKLTSLESVDNQLTDMMEQAKALAEALETYGAHSSSCNFQYDYPGQPCQCDCGLHAAKVAHHA